MRNDQNIKISCTVRAILRDLLLQLFHFEAPAQRARQRRDIPITTVGLPPSLASTYISLKAWTNDPSAKRNCKKSPILFRQFPFGDALGINNRNYNIIDGCKCSTNTAKNDDIHVVYLVLGQNLIFL